MSNDNTPTLKNLKQRIIHKKDGEEFEIPPEGSLGLLALGAVGIQLWRKKQREVNYKNPNENVIIKKKEEKKNKSSDE